MILGLAYFGLTPDETAEIESDVFDEAVTEYHYIQFDFLNELKSMAGFVRSGFAGRYNDHKKLEILWYGLSSRTSRRRHRR